MSLKVDRKSELTLISTSQDSLVISSLSMCKILWDRTLSMSKVILQKLDSLQMDNSLKKSNKAQVDMITVMNLDLTSKEQNRHLILKKAAKSPVSCWLIKFQETSTFPLMHLVIFSQEYSKKHA